MPRESIRAVGVVALFLALTYAYFYPGSRLALEGSRTLVMSEDTDPAPLPYTYSHLLELFPARWTDMLYGAVAIDQGNPAHARATWFAWNERWIVTALSPFLPLEQLSTGLTLVLVLLNAFSFYFLAKRWGWTEPIALATAISWAFCPYTRARGKVHPALVGTYHLPLVFLGLHLLARERSKRSVALAALCFLLATTVFAYLVIVAAVLAPLYVVYLWMEDERGERARLLARAGLAALPAIAFVGWTVSRPLAPGANVPRAEAIPATGEAPAGKRFHPLLKVSAARAYDYLASDLDLAALTRPLELRGKDLPREEQTHEWFWPRRLVNDYVLARIGSSAPHERSVGVRWVLIGLAIAALVRVRGEDSRRIRFFAGFAFVSLWLSLSPESPFPGFGLSGWVWRLVHQYRVPSRAGIGVHFGILAIVGTFAMQIRHGRKGRWIAGLLPLLVLVDYPPLLTAMPVAPMRPAFTGLAREGRCATGLLFPPNVSDWYDENRYYHFKQRLRRSHCTIVNGFDDAPSVANLQARFPPRPQTLEELVDSPAARDKLISFVRCMDLGWLAFDESTPKATRAEICTRLGWDENDDATCRARETKPPTAKFPSDCP